MPNILKVTVSGNTPLAIAEFGGRTFECVVGKAGVIAALDKREGDGKTPLGRWALVDGYYRPDRRRPHGICKEKMNIGMGWCDAPEDKLYNKLCDAQYAASHEMMWREDTSYDYVAVMNYNLSGRRDFQGRGLGSAIFLHVWREGAEFTEGCVALKEADLEAVLNADVDMVEIVAA